MCVTRFQSTLPVRGATAHTERDASGNEISIHAPRAGSDRQKVERQPSSDHFNPRSPCGERQCQDRRKHRPYHFNPRSPCGERQETLGRIPRTENFNPRSPCGERHRHGGGHAFQRNFNPRSPCGERRTLPVLSPTVPKFQSTLPVRGATHKGNRACIDFIISIHAPRAGSDLFAAQAVDICDDISIHAPRAGSDNAERLKLRALAIISIHAPRAGSDYDFGKSNIVEDISIHAPRAGSDMICNRALQP